MQNLLCLLLNFEAASALKVNVEKSKLIGVGLVHNLEYLAEVFDCQIEDLMRTWKPRWNPQMGQFVKNLEVNKVYIRRGSFASI